MEKLVYLFEEGSAELKSTLGLKGSELSEMTKLGIPVPHGFIISSDSFAEGRLAETAEKQIREALWVLERKTGKKFGGMLNPLLISVRSSPSMLMPGMMDTILNVGMNDDTAIGLIAQTANPRFAYDCYRRFLQMFGNVAFGIGIERFEEIFSEYKNGRKDKDVDSNELIKLIKEYKHLASDVAQKAFPDDPLDQLKMSIKAVYDSYNSKRAQEYRKIKGITVTEGTAVVIQVMVFGNYDDRSACGVGFTRNPITGEKDFYGEYILNAQGEDIVAGIRVPHKLSDMKNQISSAYSEIERISIILEKKYRDIRDYEFTIERGNLWILENGTAERSPRAQIKTCVDLVKDGLLTIDEAIMRIEPSVIERIMHKVVDERELKNIIAKGIPASPGVATGAVVFSQKRAKELSSDKKVILVREEMNPEDIVGMNSSEGILTSSGGKTSHATVVVRGMGKPCIVGCSELNIEENMFTANGKTVKEGDIITIDGNTGEVIIGNVKISDNAIDNNIKQILEWCSKKKKIGVLANAEQIQDVKKSLELGAEGIGLCRTEHMFFNPERISIVRKMIMASSQEERKKHLDSLLPLQTSDFYEIFKIMDGKPVTIRLLDPPLHEFLPNVSEFVDPQTVKRIEELHEQNPMLGTRGCRVGILYPDIFRMQVIAVIKAAATAIKEGGKPLPEIMIPLVGHKNEIIHLRKEIAEAARITMDEESVSFSLPIGTMIELPRACLTADEIAENADFFSFGTNDLTQTTYGISRDDAEKKFINHYLERKIFEHNPFAKIDVQGVGKLIKMASGLARATKQSIKIGICGEHGGDSASIEFFLEAGVDYVSCSPYRIPGAIITAAQCEIRSPHK